MTPGPRQWNRLAWAAHLVILVGGFGILLYCNRDQWFFGDEWEFLGHRGVFNGDRGLWAAHTEHWSTGPILIYRGLYSRYGLHSYLPYAAVLILLHVAVTHFLWRLMRQVGVDVGLATALSAVYILLGAGYENLLWAFQIGFIGSVAFGLAALVAVNHPGRWQARDVTAWFLSIVGLMFSGVSVTLVAVAGLTVATRRGWRQAMLTVAVPGAAYLTWFLLAGEDTVGSTTRTLDDLFIYPDYIWTGLRSAVELTLGFPGAGPIVLLGLAAFLLRRAGTSAGPSAPAFACALGTVLLFAIIAAGRAGLGVEQAEASRYAYIVMALALPAIGLALSELAGQAAPGGPVDEATPTGAVDAPPGDRSTGRARPGRRAVICVVLLLVTVHNGGILRDQSRIEKRREQRLKARILAAAQLVSSPAVILGGNPEPDFSPDIVVDDLRRMQRDAKLPTPSRITPADRMAVATVLQYAVNPGELATPFTAPQVDGVVGATYQGDGAGCIRLVPSAPVAELHLAGGHAMSLRVTADMSGVLVGFLRTFTPSALTGPPHPDEIKAGVAVYVNVTATVDQVVLRVPPSGTTQVCGVL